MGFLETLRRVKEIEVRQRPGGAVELRQGWMPYNPSLVFLLSTAFFAFPVVAFFGLPTSRDEFALFGCVMGFILYAVAAQCFNSTHVSANGGGLSWRHRPFPWRRGSSWIALSEIAAISFGQQPRRLSAQESDHQFRTGYRPPVFYAVSVRLSAARDRRVFNNILNEDDAARAARAIALALGGVAVEQTIQHDQLRRSKDRLVAIATIGAFLLIALIVILASRQ